MTQTNTPQIAAGQSHPHLVPAFVSWYFGERPQEIVALYLRYAGAFSESFAMLFMLKTMFAPWKSITDEYPTKGLNLQAITATFFLNLTSRAIGFVVRIAAIVMGLFTQLVLLTGFMAYLAVWLLYPVLLVLAIPFLLAFSF